MCKLVSRPRQGLSSGEEKDGTGTGRLSVPPRLEVTQFLRPCGEIAPLWLLLEKSRIIPRWRSSCLPAAARCRSRRSQAAALGHFLEKGELFHSGELVDCPDTSPERIAWPVGLMVGYVWLVGQSGMLKVNKLLSARSPGSRENLEIIEFLARQPSEGEGIMIGGGQRGTGVGAISCLSAGR
jgi:hypothetical protein